MAIDVKENPFVAGPCYFEAGDIVMLVSDGPDMTVVDVCEDCGMVEVAWFSGGGDNFCVETFPAICLELAS